MTKKLILLLKVFCLKSGPILMKYHIGTIWQNWVGLKFDPKVLFQ